MTKEKRKIIVAEDSRELCDLLRSILEGEGYEVDFVHDGFSLIAYLKKTQDVDAVILDLIMPEKGGISIFDTVRSVSPASKLIIYTGYTSYRHSTPIFFTWGFLYIHDAHYDWPPFKYFKANI